MRNERGFTFIELILYVAILTIVLSALVPFAWNAVETGVKSSVQQEVNANARYVSERIKYEIRNALGINSMSSTTIVLCETSGACATNPTTITYTSPNITIQNKGAAAENLNSVNTSINSLTFMNYTSGDLKTKHIQFTINIAAKYGPARQEYQDSVVIESSAEVRSN